MKVARPAQQLPRHPLHRHLRDSARKRKDRPVIRPSKHDRHARPQPSVNNNPARINPPLPKRINHEPPEQIIANNRGDSRPQPQPSSGTGHDRARPADSQLSLANQPLSLPKRDVQLSISEHQIRVNVTKDKQIQIPPRPRSPKQAHRIASPVAESNR